MPTADGQRTMQDALDEIAGAAQRTGELAKEGFVLSKEWWISLRDNIRLQEKLLREIAP